MSMSIEVRAEPRPRRAWRSKALSAGWLVAGLALAAWLIAHVGASAILKGLEAAGWQGFLAILGVRLVVTLLMGLAWWRLRRVGKRRSFVWGRLLRDAGAEILPLSQLGGYLLATRSVVLHGASGAAAAASVIADATLEFCAQIAFVLIGIYALLALTHNSFVAIPVVGGTVAMISAAAATLVFLRRQGFRIPARRALSVLPVKFRAALSMGAAVQMELRNILPLRRVWPSFGLHFAAWMLSAVEAWLALRFLGAKLDFAMVLSLEGLLYAVRSVAFLVPSAAGVQEGAYLLLGAALGLKPELVLGLSLLKRGRDLALGIPTLLSWHFAECRRG